MPPSLFNAQYQNDPSGMKGVKFDVDWLHFYDDMTIPPIRNLVGFKAVTLLHQKENLQTTLDIAQQGKTPILV